MHNRPTWLGVVMPDRVLDAVEYNVAPISDMENMTC